MFMHWGMPERMCCTEPPGAWADALCALEVVGWGRMLLDVPSGCGRRAVPVMATLVFASG